MIFFGTSKFSTDVLDRLLELDIAPTCIITVPDKPQGRKMLLTPPPAKLWAADHTIPCIQFEKLKKYTADGHEVDPEQILRELTANTPSDSQIYIVAAYGKIIPQAILDIPKLGALNVHPSLLPKYRGASPLQSTLLSNEQKLGVCIIKMDAEMDHGPIAAVELLTPGTGVLNQWPLRFSDYEKITATIGANLIASILPDIAAGTHKYTDQKHEEATYTKKITKEDGHVTELTRIAVENHGELRKQEGLSTLNLEQGLHTYVRFCALSQWPGLYFFIKKDNKDFRIKISDMHWHSDTQFAEITKVIPEGKKEMSWKDFLNFI